MTSAQDIHSKEPKYIDLLSDLLLVSACQEGISISARRLEPLRSALSFFAQLNVDDLERFRTLADSHHVIVRGLSAVRNGAMLEGYPDLVSWCEAALAAECARITNAIDTLHQLCDLLENRGFPIAVIKSLDHWPDLGSDLDLFTTADHADVDRVLSHELGARAVERSWGDRLAGKWNYKVPGLPEFVEIHFQHLGQTGELSTLANRVISRRIEKEVNGLQFYVPAPEERIVISALQRVYRHFYYRLCDMVDTAGLLQSGDLDFEELQRAADGESIWRGVATYLVLVRNYADGHGCFLHLPQQVLSAAPIGDAQVQFRNGFLRVSMKTGVELYGRQLLGAASRRDGRALRRLPLLPPLAVTAWLAHSVTGNDKGIW
jgi:hypothetical protein